MGDTTSSTLALFDGLTAPRPELCAALSCHDPLPGTPDLFGGAA